jgi:hypothetical protein
MRNRPGVVFAAFVLVLLFSLSGCGGGSGSVPPQQVLVHVSVFPSQATVAAGATQTFFATVTGTANHLVTWKVNGAIGGDATSGTIDSTGLYTAPATIPSPATVTVSALSQADPTKSGAASITIAIGVAVSPNSIPLNIGGVQQQFTAVVSGSGNSAVDWTVNGLPPGDPNTTFGTITTSGLYTSPNAIPNPPNFQVTATSQADPTRSGSAGVAISAGGPGVNQAPQNAPIKLGTSGGNANDHSAGFCCSGTLGALVTRGGTDFILSNNHVLARTDQAIAGEPINQPGLVDNNCAPATPVANFTQKVKLKNNPNNIAPADAALAQVTSGEVDPTGAILQLGSISGGLAQPAPPANTTVTAAIGMAVAKSGRTSGLTCDTIAAINVTVQVQYENTCGSNSTFLVTYNNQVEIDSTTFSSAGDSGSLIVNAQTAEPVALLFAGDNTSTLANPIQAVLTALADPKDPTVLPTFVGGAKHPVSACTGTFSQLSGIAQNLAKSFSRPTDAEIDRAATAKENHVTALMADPAIIGVGVGAGDAPGEAAIIVFADQAKSHMPIPATLDGVRTKVKNVERFHAFDVLACPAKNRAHARSISLR